MTKTKSNHHFTTVLKPSFQDMWHQVSAQRPSGMERRVGKRKTEKNLFHIKISHSDTLSNSYLLLKTQNFIQKMFTVVSNEGEIQLFPFRYPILCSKVVVPQMES